jgi:hypothetical protein
MLLAVAMLALGSSSAMAQRGGGDGGGGGGGGGGGDGGGRGKVTICHQTHSDRNPWVKITVSEHALDAHERHGDTFPDADGDCPGRDIPDQDGNGNNGHDGDGHEGNGHDGHDGDGHDGHDGDGDDGDNGDASCSVSQDNASDNSTGTTTQSGLINLNNIVLTGNNLDVLGNLLCQADFLNDLTVGLLGTAIGDSDGHHHGGGGLLGGLFGGDSVLSSLGVLF